MFFISDHFLKKTTVMIAFFLILEKPIIWLFWVLSARLTGKFNFPEKSSSVTVTYLRCSESKQKINRQQPTNCLSVFDHFVEFALKVLRTDE